MKLCQTEKLISEISLIGQKFTKIQSIMLVGSASRNELRVLNDEIVSDFEFVFFVGNFFYEKHIVIDTVSYLANKYSIQIDISFFNGRREIKFPKRLFFYDLVATGKVIYGKDYVTNSPPLKASELDPKDVSNIIFYRALDILINSPLDSISPSSLCRNMSYVYLYALINEGILEKDFRSRFARIETIAKTNSDLKNSLSESFFRKLGPDYFAIKSSRMETTISSYDDYEVTLMLNKFLQAVEYAIDTEVFSIKHNLKYILRYIKSALQNVSLFCHIKILFSKNPRKKLLLEIKKEFIERKKITGTKKRYLEPLLLKNIYERNML